MTTDGVLFVFALADCETQAFITYDPVFNDVSGFHLEPNSILTEDMVSKMTEDMVSTGIVPPNPKMNVHEFLYSYTCCMERTYVSTKTPKAFVVVHYHF